MMYQAYLLTISYLLINAGLLLGDEYGGQFLILLRLRNTVKSSLPVHIVLIVFGFLLAVWKIIFPISPGPVLLGDLFCAFCLLVMAVYHMTQLKVFRKTKKGNSPSSEATDSPIFQKTGTYIEKHKRNLGYLLLGVSVLHFLFPSAVLL